MNQYYALIIDDDPKLGMVFKKALQQAGFEAELDATGAQFASHLPARVPDLVILDIHLPYASGPEILEKVRSDARWAGTFVIVTTADLYLAKSMEDQADHVLIKPVSVSRLMKLIANHWPEEIGPQQFL